MRKPTKKQMILGFIAESSNGRTFGEIQRYIVELNGLNYDQFELVRDYNHFPTRVSRGQSIEYVGPWKMVRRRRYRGYWCTNLVGSHYGREGILAANCNKINGRYLIKDRAPNFIHDTL